MSKVLIEEQTLYDIGDAIREKAGYQLTYKPSEMANAITRISLGQKVAFVNLDQSINPEQYANGTVLVNSDIKPRGPLVCDGAYLVTRTDKVLATHSVAFCKINTDPAIGVHYKAGNFYGPLLASPISADAVKMTANAGTTYSANIDGITWYLSTSYSWNQGSDSPSIPKLYDIGLEVNNTNAQAIIQAMIDASHAIYDPDKADDIMVTVLGDIYIISDGELVTANTISMDELNRLLS